MKRILALALFCLIASLFGCQKLSSKANEGMSAAKKTLRYAIPTNPTTLDPAKVQDGDTLDLLQNVYEGLVGWDPMNQPVGLVAEKWDISPDGATYTFHIRKGIKFQNGTPVTADDVKWSIERACTPSVQSTTADSYMSDIIGVTDMVNGKAQEVSGIKVIDPATVSVTLHKAVPYFLGKFTYLVSAIVPKGALPMKELTDYTQAIGTGPFKIAQYVPNQLVVLDANPDYWGGKPLLDHIERPVVLDSSTRLNKFKAGELDMLILQRDDVPSIKADQTLLPMMVKHDRPAIWYIGLNQNQYEPFKKREVRQAFAMAIDREKIVNEQLQGFNELANCIVPPGIKGGDRPNANMLAYDPVKAKALLVKAGYPDPTKMPKLTLTFREGYTDAKLVSEAVASMITQNLGVPVTSQPMEWRSYLDSYDKGQQTFYHLRWSADYLDPENFLSHMLTTTGPENKFGYSNKEYDQLCAQADSEMDWDKRLPLYAKAEDIVLQDAPWIPIYFQKDYELVRPTVKGLRESLFGHLPHTTTEVTEVPVAH